MHLNCAKRSKKTAKNKNVTVQDHAHGSKPDVADAVIASAKTEPHAIAAPAKQPNLIKSDAASTSASTRRPGTGTQRMDDASTSLSKSHQVTSPTKTKRNITTSWSRLMRASRTCQPQTTSTWTKGRRQAQHINREHVSEAPKAHNVHQVC